jgi:hypothetical protein
MASSPASSFHCFPSPNTACASIYSMYFKASVVPASQMLLGQSCWFDLMPYLQVGNKVAVFEPLSSLKTGPRPITQLIVFSNLSGGNVSCEIYCVSISTWSFLVTLFLLNSSNSDFANRRSLTGPW